MDNKQLDKLLKISSEKLGTSPDKLMEAAKNGDIDKLLGNGKQAKAIKKVLSDPKAADKLLSGEQAQLLLKLLGGKGNG